MKRIVISVCLLYAGNSCAMGGAVARGLLVTTLPITVTAAYYCNETNVQRAVLKNEMETKGTHSAEEIQDAVSKINPLKTFAYGVPQGIVPGVNIAKLNNGSSVGKRGVSVMAPEEKAGFYAGLSLYPAVGAYVMLLDVLQFLRIAK